MWDLIIKNGCIVNYDQQIQATLYIRDGKVVEIKEIPDDSEAKKIIDAQGKYVLPGIIDTHVHSRDRGATHKEDFYHSTLSAAAGGVTTIFEMPNTFPAVSNRENFEIQKKNLLSKANVNFGMWGICLGELNLADLKDLDELGVIGYKYFWGYAINKENYQLVYNYSDELKNIIPPLNDGQVFKMIEEVAKTNKIFAVHAENSDLINTLTPIYKELGNDYENLIQARPHIAEETTAYVGIAMAKQLNAKFHVLHISSAGTVDMIERERQSSSLITSETCPHYLFLTNEDFEKHGSMMKVYPPVKYKEDQGRLWQGINDGVISIVCSDHAPHTLEDKQQNIWEASAGMCGVQSMLPLMLNAVTNKKLSLQKLVEVMSYNPAQLFGLASKGFLAEGTDADITIVDMEAPFKIETEKLYSISKVTAFDGYEGVGKPVYTIVNGTVVMENDAIVEERKGQFIAV